MAKKILHLDGNEDRFSKTAKFIFEELSSACPDLPIENRRAVTTIISFYDMSHNQHGKSDKGSFKERVTNYTNNLKEYFKKHQFQNELPGWVDVLIVAISGIDVKENIDNAEANFLELDEEELNDIIVDSAVIEIQRKLSEEKSPGILKKLRQKLKKITKYGQQHDLVAMNNIILNIDSISESINSQISNNKNKKRHRSTIGRFFQRIRDSYTSQNNIINNAIKQSVPKFQFFKFINKKIFPNLVRLTNVLVANRLVKKKKAKKAKIAHKRHMHKKELKEQIYNMFNSHDPVKYVKLPSFMMGSDVKREAARLRNSGFSEVEAATKSIETVNRDKLESKVRSAKGFSI